MNRQAWRAAIRVLTLVLLAAIPAQTVGHAQTPVAATPVAATPVVATPVAVDAPQTWHVQVNNVSPANQNWSFNAFYPDNLQAHPGDTIVFTLAQNPNAFHTVMVLVQGMTPMEMYQGFAGGFVQPNPNQTDQLQSAYLWQPAEPAMRACWPGSVPYSATRQHRIRHQLRPSSTTRQRVATNATPRSWSRWTRRCPLVPYYFMSLVDGPTMSGRIDVVAPDQPVQSAAELQVAAERQYQADLAVLAGYDRVGNPPESSNPDGTKTWQVDAGGSPDNARLSINEFSLPQIVIHAGDTVTWTNRSPASVAHTVTASPRPDATSRGHEPVPAGLRQRHRRTATAPAGELPA